MHSSFENTIYIDQYITFLRKFWKIMRIFFENVHILYYLSCW